MYKSLPKFCTKHSEGVTEHLRSLIWVLGMSLLACPWKCSRRRQAWWAKGSVRRVSSNHGRSDDSKSFLQLEAHGQSKTEMQTRNKPFCGSCGWRSEKQLGQWSSGGFQPEEMAPASSGVVSGHQWGRTSLLSGLICSFIYVYIKDQDGLTYQKITL